MEREFDIRILRMSEARIKGIGVNGSLFLNQLRYWLERSENKRDGRLWVYKTYAQWAEELPFSKNTIIRTVEKLEELGVIITSIVHNRKGYDNTKWYTIDENAIKKLLISTQNGYTENPKWVDRTTQNGKTNTKEYTENTTEEYKDINRAFQGTAPCVPFSGYDDDLLTEQFNRIAGWLVQEYGVEAANECEKVLAYYMGKYAKEMHKPHPVLKDEKLAEVAGRIISGTGIFEGLIEDSMNYVEMIQLHFNRDYGMPIDYNICHFATEGIIEKLAYELHY